VSLRGVVDRSSIKLDQQSHPIRPSNETTGMMRLPLYQEGLLVIDLLEPRLSYDHAGVLGRDSFLLVSSISVLDQA
jgi:hypothetical protein